MPTEKGALIEGWFTTRNIVFLCLICTASVLFFRPLAIVVGSSVSADQYSQVLVVPPISLTLLYLERNSIFANLSYNRMGIVVFTLCSFLFVFLTFSGRTMDHSVYIALAILLSCGCSLGAFLFCYGPTAFRRATFPLCFLVLMTPLPDTLRNRVIVFLQYGSAVVTDWFFSLARIPYSRDGVIIVLPSVTIEIAQECSGIRSSLILVIGGLVLGHLFLRKMWTRAVMIGLLVPLTIAKNGLRIFALSTLGMYVDPSFLSGRLHRQGGIVFFAISFVALWLLVWILQKLEGQQTHAQDRPAGMMKHDLVN